MRTKNLALWSAFHAQEDEKLIQAILEGDDVNDFSETGDTILHALLKQNASISMIQFLLDHGADVNLKTGYNVSPLWLASKNCGADKVALLLTKQVDIEDSTEDNFTPLMIAAKYCNVDVIKLLIDHGADVQKKSNAGLTALDYAINSIWGVGIDKKNASILLQAANEKIMLDDFIKCDNTIGDYVNLFFY